MKKLVMVIDDDESYVYLIKRKLKALESDISFVACSTGKEAFEYFTSLDKADYFPNVIILDLNMPVMNGFRFLEVFTQFCVENGIHTPPPIVLIATSSDVPADRKRVAEFKMASDYLVKPINVLRVAEALHQG